MHSENFYLHFFNLLFGYKLENLNTFLQNVEAIDLIDHTNKIVIQVSATNTKQKVESTLEKEIIKTYSAYTFKFISISFSLIKIFFPKMVAYGWAMVRSAFQCLIFLFTRFFN